jgi:glycosyltransferase involved in cell wall biosynthesis
LDRKYIRLMMPVYCKKASAIISVSQITTDTFNQLFSLPKEKVKTVYFAPGKQFKRIENESILQNIRANYDLPEKFILTVTGYDRGPRKNIKGILEAYKIHHGKTPHKLVIAGKDCYRFKEDYAIPDHGYGGDIVFPGWVDQKDLPAFYSLADLFLYPSIVEAFPIPITEALACGTPIVTSNANGLKEIAGDAALFIDPQKPEEIAGAMCRVLSDSAVQSDLSSKGLQRAQVFNWRKCATETLGIIESL